MSRKRWTQKGNALIEAGLAIPAMCIMFAGVADFGRSFRAYNEALSAARDASQVVINDYSSYRTSGSDSMITAAVANDSTLSGLSGTITRFYTCPNSEGDDFGRKYTTPQSCDNQRIYVKIVASAPFTAVTPHPMIPYPSTINGTAMIRVQ